MRPYLKFCDLGHFRKYNDYKKKLRLLGNRAACGRANAFFIHKHKIVLQKNKTFRQTRISFKDKLRTISMKIMMKLIYIQKKYKQGNNSKKTKNVNNESSFSHV